MGVITEPFEVFVNEDKELLFSLKAKQNVPASPRLYYGGDKTAVLVRDAKYTISLQGFSTRIHDIMQDTDNVAIVETDDRGNVKHEYFAPVSHVRNLEDITG